MKKKDLVRAASLSTSTLAKLTKGQNLNTDVLLRICCALQCDISDIMEVILDD